MSKKKTNKKSIWSVSGLEKRIQVLIASGLLKKENGLEEIVKTINAEFGEQLKADGLKFSLFALKTRLNKLVWAKNIEGDLWRFHRNNMMSEFRKMFSYIPEEMVIKREKELKGFTHSQSVTEFKAGMGRLSVGNLPADASHYEFPHITYKEPFVVSNASEGQLPVVNGALIGSKHTDIERNTLRRALSDARKRNAVAVVLTNVMELWTKRTAGYLAVYRSEVDGIIPNPERFSASYRKTVQDILDGKITDEMIYMTLKLK